MSDDDSVANLVRRWQAGDQDAAGELYVRYARQLARLADQHLSAKLAARLDGADIMQSAFRTFFRRCSEGHFQVNSASQIWRLLVRITRRKVAAKARFHTADRRSVNAEAPGGNAWLPEALARDPSPEDAATFVDLIEMVLRDLKPLHVQVLQLWLELDDTAEIAARLGCSTRTVERAIRLFEQRLQSALVNGEP